MWTSHVWRKKTSTRCCTITVYPFSLYFLLNRWIQLMSIILIILRCTHKDKGSLHAKSPKIKKISRVTISDFDENWLKCSSTYMMATCKKVLSSGDKFYFYSHIYTGGGVFPISYSWCRIWMIACFKMMIIFVFFKLSKWKFILYHIVILEIEFWHHFVSICDTVYD